MQNWGIVGKRDLSNGEDNQHPAKSLDRMEADNITVGLAFWQNPTLKKKGEEFLLKTGTSKHA